MIRYLSAQGNETIEIADTVLAHIDRHVQRRSRLAEAGGQLFASFAPGLVRIERATGPSCLDRRGRFSFSPSNLNARRIIRAMHKRRLHYVGDWHTHPEPVPNPSGDDRRAIGSAFRESKHRLTGFLMVIAGTLPAPHGLYVAIADGTELHQLAPVPGEERSPTRQEPSVVPDSYSSNAQERGYGWGYGDKSK